MANPVRELARWLRNGKNSESVASPPVAAQATGEPAKTVWLVDEVYQEIWDNDEDAIYDDLWPRNDNGERAPLDAGSDTLADSESGAQRSSALMLGTNSVLAEIWDNDEDAIYDDL